MTFISKVTNSLFFVIFLITLISFIFPGYKILSTDQIIYFPQILNSSIPELAKNDMLYSFTQIDMTIFDEILLLFQRLFHINIFVTTFLWTFITRFTYFISIFYISLYFTKNKIFSLLSPLLFLTGSIVYGTLTLTMEPSLHPRIIALSICLLATASVLYKRLLFAALLLGCAVFIHPLSTIPFLAFYYIDVFLIPWKDIQKNITSKWVLGLIPILFSVLAFTLFHSDSGQSLFTRLDDEWFSIVKNRDSYIFLQSWDFLGTVHFVSTAIFFVVSVIEFKSVLQKDRKKYFYLFIVVPILLSSLFFVVAELFHVLTIFQLYRSLILWKIIVTLFFSYYAFKRVTEKPKDYILNFTLLGIILSIVIQEYVLFIFLPVFFIIWLKSKFVDKHSAKIPSQIKSIIRFLNKPLLLILLITLFTAFFIVMSMKIDYEKWLEYPISIYISAVMLLSFILTFYHEAVVSTVKFFNRSSAKIGLVVILLLILSVVVKVKPKITSNKNFAELCSWLQSNTTLNTVLVTEPFAEETVDIRFFCQRSVFYSYKDGAQVAFNKEYAKEWFRRYKLATELEMHPDKIENEKVDFVISEKPIHFSNMTLVFENSEYKVYAR